MQVVISSAVALLLYGVCLVPAVLIYRGAPTGAPALRLSLGGLGLLLAVVAAVWAFF